MPIIVSAGHVWFLLHQREKKGSTIQYGDRKWGTELMQEYLPKHSRIGTARLK